MHTANTPKVTVVLLTIQHTHTHTDELACVALKNSGNAEGGTDSIYPQLNRTLKQRNEETEAVECLAHVQWD